MTHRHDFGIVAAADSHTAAWVKNLAADFRYGSDTTRAYARWEREQAIVFQGFIHGDAMKKKKAKHAISKILEFNGFHGSFDVSTWDTKVPNGVFMEFIPKGDLLTHLANVKKLRAPSCTINLLKRVRKARSEAEFLQLCT